MTATPPTTPSARRDRRRARRFGVATLATAGLLGAALVGPAAVASPTTSSVSGSTPDRAVLAEAEADDATALSGATVRPGDAGAGGVGIADHEGNPSAAELLEQCENGIDYCEFHPSGENIQRGDYQLAGTAENCTSDTQDRAISWSRTEGETNSLGFSISASTGVKGIFEASVTSTYNHEWSWTETNTNTVTQTVSPGKAVAIHVAADRSTVTGQWELHFGDRYEGHYYWYIDNAEISAPTFQTPWHTRTEEIDANC
ncbi:MAG TPA: hypothetical protein VGE77_13985 [Nocardioides sp.]